MASRRSLALWLAASLLLVACNFHQDGLSGASEETDDGGGLVGLPGSGGSLSGGGGAGSGGTGGALIPDPAPSPGPPDAAVVLPPPLPPPPDAAVIAPPPADAAPVVVPPPPPVPPDAAPAPPPVPDAAPVVPRDAGVISPPPVNTVACGSARCVVGQQACCVTAASSTCIPLSGICLGGAARRCDGPEDCDGGRICCAHPDPQGGYRSACNRPMECAQMGGATICRTAADCPGVNRTCAPVVLSGATVNICR